MNNNIMASVLSAHVANETIKRMNANSSEEYAVENKHTREKEREEMEFGFIFGVLLGIAYLLTPSNKDAFIDSVYICFYLLCHMAVLSVSWNDKQSPRAIKTSLVLSSILALAMLTPFILDMDTQIHFREITWIVGGVELYREYTDYTNLIQIAIMDVFLLIDIVIPIYRLRKICH